MKKNKANRVLTSKPFFIVVSILISIVLWLYVVNVENTEVDVEVKNIPVTFIGADDILADRQLLVKNQEAQSVSLVIRCKRSLSTSMKAENIDVTVDLTDIRSTGIHDRIYNVTLPKGVREKDALVIGKDPQYIPVEIVQLSSKPVPVRGILNGGAAEGYMAKQLEFAPEVINISGPQETVNAVSYASVVVDRENLSKTVVETKSYTFMDEDGNKVPSDELTVDVETVTVTVPIVMYKEVVLGIDLIEGGGAKESNAVVEIMPKTITLAGDAELLESLNQITLGAIDLASFESTFSGTFPIKISNELENVSKTNEATVSVNLKGLTVKHVQAKNISVIHATEGYTATIKTLFVDVKVRGPEAVVKLIDTYSIRVVADLADLGDFTGNKQVKAEVYVDGYPDAGVIGDYDVVVSVEKLPGGKRDGS